MRSLAPAAMLLIAACAAQPGPVAGRPSPASAASASPSPLESPTASADESPSPVPSPTLPPAPSVQCVKGAVPSYQALVAGANEWLLYDVTDPLRPRVVCRMAGTQVHIVTGTSFAYLVPRANGTTDIVLHALGSNNESVVATMQSNFSVTYGGAFGVVAWAPALDQLAYLGDGGSDANGLEITDVWLASARGRTKVYSYAVPGRDAFGRPGFPPPILAFSPDGSYLAAGWTVGTTAPRVFHLPDLANVTPAWPSDFRRAMWGRTGHTLLVLGLHAVAEWTPGAPLRGLPSTPGWAWEPNLSPSGAQVAFTAITSTGDVRPYVYDLMARSSRLLVDKPRSAALFVRTGWIWQLEEKPCVQSADSSCFDITIPDGQVLAFDLASGRETAVTFAAGELPFDPHAYVGMNPGELWPNA